MYPQSSLSPLGPASPQLPRLPMPLVCLINIFPYTGNSTASEVNDGWKMMADAGLSQPL
jgi:hypothetical protein